jgi:immune inhibitor A
MSKKSYFLFSKIIFVLSSLLCVSIAFAMPPKDKIPYPDGQFIGGEIDQPNPKDYARMLKRQQLMEKFQKHLKATGMADEALLSEIKALAVSGSERILVILVEFGGPDTFTWTPGVSTWDPYGRKDESEYTGNASDLGKPAACNNIISKFGITGPKDFTYNGPLHNQIERPLSYDDHSGTMIWTTDFNQAFYYDLIFGNGVILNYTRQDGSVVNENFIGKSVNRYYNDISGGTYSIIGDVVGWVKVPHSVWWYGADPCPGAQSNNKSHGGIPGAGNARTLVIDALEAVKKAYPDFNWSQYDQNGDGVIDRLWIIHAGLGQEEGATLLNRTDYGEGGLWSHSSSVSLNYEIVPGVKAGLYIMMPENGGIGVLAHEFGHNLGAMDLYAYGEGETSAGFWTMMADNWTGYPILFQPPAMDPWHLDNWGWLNPMLVLDPASVYTISIGQASYFPGGTNVYRGVKIPLPDGHRPVSVVPNGNSQWWGGYGTLLNARMILKNPIRIPSGGAALTFKNAYDTLTDWDFLWVQVSKDGGGTWTTITNSHTTCDHADGWIGGLNGFPDDLCGAGIGGFTGRMDGFPSYRIESFDMSSFAGQNILVRFWYMTNWKNNWEGPFIDDIQITSGPATIFSDNAESGDSNWNYEGGWSRIDGMETFTHNYYLQWRNVSSTGGYDSALGDPRWRYGPANTGLLVWYNNNHYTDNEVFNHLFDYPGFGPKGRMLVVDAHPEPYRDPYYVAMGYDNEGGNVHSGALMRDAPFSLYDSVNFTMKPPYIHSETHFSGLPAVSTFSDATGYYPGAEYVSKGPGYSPPSQGWVTRQWDSSVALPSKTFYGIKAPGYTANEEFRYHCSKILSGTYAGKLSCTWLGANTGLGYNGGTGNPGDAGGSYGWNVRILNQTDSTGIVGIWNTSHTSDIHTLTVTRAGTGTGTVTASKGILNWIGNIGIVAYGQDSPAVVLSATEYTGSTFAGWSGCDSVSGNECTVSMVTDRFVTAIFTLIPETVSTPNILNGPTNGTPSTSYSYSTDGSVSSFGHPVQYLFDWGDGTNSDWLPVGTTSASKSWDSAGTYPVKVQARCATDASVISNWTGILSVNISQFVYTVLTSPPALEIVVDGSTYVTPQIFYWTPGSSHTLSASSPQFRLWESWTRYVYSSWSDGEAQTHTINTPFSNTTYTANFALQYSLTTEVNLLEAGTVSPSGTTWYNEGQTVSITASPSPNYALSYWWGDLFGKTNPSTLTMDSPKVVIGNFIPTIGVDGWTAVSSPDVSSGWWLNGVHFSSSDDGWAVGEDDSNSRGVLLHYANGSWTPVSPPDVSPWWGLNGVHFSSSDDGWAVGIDYENALGVLLHYVKGSWKSVSPPNLSSDWTLNGVHFSSSDDGWAVGIDYENVLGVLLHYVKGSWKSVSPPNVSSDWTLNGVHFTSSNEGWAVGQDYENEKGVLLHYSNGSWTNVTPPDVSSEWWLNGVHFTSSNEGWAVGVDASNRRGLLFHYVDGSWKNVNPPDLDSEWWLNGVYFTSSNEGWAVGGGFSDSDRGVLLRYSKGSWTSVIPPNVSPDWWFTGVHFSSSGSGWAVGNDFSSAGILLKFSEVVSVPNTPSGPSSGNAGTSYGYSVKGSSSSLGHTVQYRFDWGDGTDSGWLASGITSASKSWGSAGTYQVKARARCKEHLVESGWSAPLSVTISKPIKGPDLKGSWTKPVTQSCKATKGVKKCTIKGTFKVDNAGNSNAGSAYVDLYVSESSILEGGGIWFKQSSVGALKMGKSKTISLSYTFSPGVTVIGKYVIAVIDKDDLVTEIDETNNVIVFGPIQ